MSADVAVRYIVIPLIGAWAFQQLVRELIKTFHEAKEGLWG